MSLPSHLQLLLVGVLLGILCGLALPPMFRLCVAGLGRLLPPRYVRFHPRRVRRTVQRGESP